MMDPPRQIGVAVVEYQGCFLVGMRGKDGPLPGYAEFPGGKCLTNERPADCACRECLEESGLQVKPVQLLLNAAFEYEHATVDLHFWLCHPKVEINLAAKYRNFSWVPREKLKEHRFPEGNSRLIEILTSTGTPQQTL